MKLLNLLKLTIWAIGGFFFLGCATSSVQSLDPNERIEVYGDYMSKNYYQKGQRINVADLQENLKNIEKTQAAAKKSQFWGYFILPLAAAGGYLASSAVIDNSKSSGDRDSQLGISLGFVGGALLAAYFTQKNLDEAVNQFNEKFPPLPPPPQDTPIDPSLNPSNLDPDQNPSDEPDSNETEIDESDSSSFFNFELIPDRNKVAFEVLGGWRYRF